MIRVATQADVPEILNIYAPYIETTTVTFEYTVPSLEAFTERFRQVTEGFPWLLWEEEGKILGYAYASLPFDRAAYGWCAEPSIYLRPEARGKHIGRQLYGGPGGASAANGLHPVLRRDHRRKQRQPGLSPGPGLQPVRTFPSLRLEIWQMVGCLLVGETAEFCRNSQEYACYLV